MVRPSGRIVSSCIQFGPVVGLGKSAWETVRSFSCTRRVSAAFHFQAKAGIGSGAREGRAPSRPKSPRYSAAALTAFGESIPASQPLNTSTSQQFFTGKPLPVKVRQVRALGGIHTLTS